MTAYLVDTHTLIWATAESGKLSEKVRTLLNNSTQRIFVSHATLWELSIKQTLGKIQLPERFFADLPNLGYEMLPLSVEHFSVYRQLPLLHRDPFDRILAAQAKAEDLTLITCDTEIQEYDIKWVW